MKILTTTYNKHSTCTTIYHLLVALLLIMTPSTLSATASGEAIDHHLEIKQEIKYTTTPQDTKVDLTRKKEKKSSQTIDKTSEKKRVLKETIEEVIGNHINYAFATDIIARYAAFDLEEARKHYNKMVDKRKEMEEAYSEVNKASQKANKHYQEADQAYCKGDREAYYATDKNWELNIRAYNIIYKPDEKTRAIKQAIEKVIDTNVTCTFADTIARYVAFDLEEKRKKAWYQKEEMQHKRKEARQKYRKVQEEEEKAWNTYEDIFLKYEKEKPAFKDWHILDTYVKANARYLEAEEKYKEAEEKYKEVEEKYKEVEEKYKEAKEKYKEVEEKYKEAKEKYKEAKDNMNLNYIIKWTNYNQERDNYDEVRKQLQAKYSGYMLNRTLKNYKGDLKEWNDYKEDLCALDLWGG